MIIDCCCLECSKLLWFLRLFSLLSLPPAPGPEHLTFSCHCVCLLVFSEDPIQDSGTSCAEVSCSSGENNFKNPRILDDPEGDRQRQSGDGATSLPASQPEAGRGTQKKPQGKRRDQKSSEGLDMQGKPGSKGVILPSKRSPLPSKLQGEKGNNSSVRLRRNASSAGRLQGLSSGSSTGSLGRKESKISEANPKWMRSSAIRGQNDGYRIKQRRMKKMNNNKRRNRYCRFQNYHLREVFWTIRRKKSRYWKVTKRKFINNYQQRNII